MVTKNQPFEELVKATTVALRGGPVLTERERLNYLTELWDLRGRQASLLEPFTRLTQREEEVLHRLCEGESVQRIAAESYVSVATVRTQVRAILLKLDVGSQLEAVAAPTGPGGTSCSRPTAPAETGPTGSPTWRPPRPAHLAALHVRT